MRRHYMAGLVVAALFLAGCTAVPGAGADGDQESTPTTPNDGLTVQFKPVKSTFQENEVLQFRLSVANTGDAKAANIEASTFGSPFIDTGGRCPSSLVGDDAIIQPNLKAGAPPQSTDSWQCAPPAAASGYGGGSSGVNVNQQLIDLSSGATDSYTAGLQVAYDYSTNATARVTVTTPSRISSRSPVTTENDAGPVKAKVNLQSPQTERSDGRMEIPVTVRNVGDGETVGSRFNGKDVKVTVTCPQCSGGDGSSATKNINLVNGRRQVVVTLDGVTLPDGADNLERSYPIEISLEYRYRERVSNGFTLSGQPAGVSVETLEQAQLPPSPEQPSGPSDEEQDDGGEGEQVDERGIQFVAERTQVNKEFYNLTVARRSQLRLDTFKIWVNEGGDLGEAKQGKSINCENQVNPAGDSAAAFQCEYRVGEEGKKYRVPTVYLAQIKDYAGNVYKAEGRILNPPSYEREDDETIGIWTNPKDYTVNETEDRTEEKITFTAEINPDAYRQHVTLANFSAQSDPIDIDGCTPEAVVEAGGSSTAVPSDDRFHLVKGGAYTPTSDGSNVPEFFAASYQCGDQPFNCFPHQGEPVSTELTTTFNKTCYAEPLMYRVSLQRDGQETEHGAVALKKILSQSKRPVWENSTPVTYSFPIVKHELNHDIVVGFQDRIELIPRRLYGCTQPSLTLRVGDPAGGDTRKDVSCGDPSLTVRPAAQGYTVTVPYGEPEDINFNVRHIFRDIPTVEITRLQAVDSSGEQTQSFDTVTCGGENSDYSPPCVATVDIPPSFAGGELQYTVRAVTNQGENQWEGSLNIEGAE
ncbi:MAG: hypothetical protein ABEI97_00430 [Candidatus Nanohaloarchaea archaeon]